MEVKNEDGINHSQERWISHSLAQAQGVCIKVDSKKVDVYFSPNHPIQSFTGDITVQAEVSSNVN